MSVDIWPRFRRWRSPQIGRRRLLSQTFQREPVCNMIDILSSLKSGEICKKMQDYRLHNEEDGMEDSRLLQSDILTREKNWINGKNYDGIVCWWRCSNFIIVIIYIIGIPHLWTVSAVSVPTPGNQGDGIAGQNSHITALQCQMCWWWWYYSLTWGIGWNIFGFSPLHSCWSKGSGGPFVWKGKIEMHLSLFCHLSMIQKILLSVPWCDGYSKTRQLNIWRDWLDAMLADPTVVRSWRSIHFTPGFLLLYHLISYQNNITSVQS